MKSHIILLVFAILFFLNIVFSYGCTHSITYPQEFSGAFPNARMLDNIYIVHNLERKQRKDTVLTSIGGGPIDMNGTLTDVSYSYWDYIYVRWEKREQGSEPIFYIWDVYPDGRIELQEPSYYDFTFSLVDIKDDLKINSDQLINLAKDYGASEFIERHINNIDINTSCYRARGKGTECVLYIDDLTLPNFHRCRMFIDAETGALIWKSAENCWMQ